MQEPTEPDLIEQARAGSRLAFGQLVSAYEDRLYRFLVTRARTPADAEDALQECFINAWRYLDSYSSRWQFSTWLYRIALRELSKLPRAEWSELSEEHADSGTRDPLADCIAHDDVENLWLQARSILSDEAFTALWLRYAEDLSVRDAARVIGRPATWLKVVVHRSKKKLAAHHRDQAHNKRADAKSVSGRHDPDIKCETVI